MILINEAQDEAWGERGKGRAPIHAEKSMTRDGASPLGEMAGLGPISTVAVWGLAPECTGHNLMNGLGMHRCG